MEYTLSLALVDFLPVAFTATGLMYIVRLVAYALPSHGTAALLGAALTVAGGLSKAGWKLIMASSAGELNIAWLEAALFILMAPGYSLLAWSVWQTARSVQGKGTSGPWLVPLSFILLVLGVSFFLFVSQPGSPRWERVLLSVMVVATVVTGVLLIVFSLRQGLTTAALLFILNLIGIFILNGLARFPEQPISLQWVEEGLNTISWLAFAAAASRVYRYARSTFGVDVQVASQLSLTAE